MKLVLMNAALVGAGGFIGAICRHGMNTLSQKFAGAYLFPIGTYVVNMLGCLLIGLVIGFAQSRQILGDEIRLFVIVGILGGFTTYSTFAYESLALIQGGEILRAFLYVVGHIVLGLALVWCGLFLADRPA